MTFSLRRRLARFLTFLGVLVLAVVAVSIVLLVQVRQHQQLVSDRYFNAVNTSSMRFIDQIDAETAVRGYALTHDPVTLQPTRALSSAAYRSQYQSLLGLLHDDATAQTGLRQWEAAAQTWVTHWALPAAIRIKAGHQLTPAQVLAGKTLFDRNRAAYSSYVGGVSRQRDAANDSMKLYTTLLFIAVIIAAAGVAAGGAALWIALRRWVISPLLDLSAETQQVTSGELDHQVQVGGPEEIVSVGRDVEAMRRDIVRQLGEVERARQEIQAAEEILRSQAEDLARSNRDLEQFAYVASHDLQEPLRKVASFCQMLDRRYTGQLDERADQYIAFAVDGAKRMQQLINDLLAFSRVGRMSQGLVEVDLQGCYDSAVQNLAASIEASDATVHCEPLPSVLGERGLLVQLLQNLIANSVKFRGAEPPVVRIGAGRRGDMWEFSCSDNGIGIEPQYAERIFVIFQRLHGKDEYEGTGIGLALCKRIVEHHGGHIWLDPTSEAGTTFRWTLQPVPEAAAEAVGQ